MSIDKKKFDINKKKFDTFIKQPPLYALINMKEFNITQPVFFWCDHSEKLKRIKIFLENPFINKENKEQFLVNFARFQRTLNAFKQLVRIWRIKKCIIYPNTTDLKGTELREYKPHLVLSLIEYNTIYSFYIHDLLKMWNIALRNRIFLIESPTELKNPYTNLEFSTTNLYNIYYKALFNGLNRPPIVDMYFNSKFSMKTLLNNYGAQLREWAITDYTETDDICLYNDLIGIQSDYGYLLPRLRVSEQFSYSIKMKQIKIYKPIIKAYCYISYSNNSHLISSYTTFFFKLAEAYSRDSSIIF